MKTTIYILLFLCFIITGTAHMAANILVIDANERSPINGATVMSGSGIILGITDSDGIFPSPAHTDYPLTIRCMGYVPTECNTGTGTVEMPIQNYQLPEYVAMADGHPISRMLCFGRSYVSIVSPTDTFLTFTKSLFDVYYSDNKVKGFKHADRKTHRLLDNSIYRHTNSTGIDSVSKGSGVFPTLNELETVPPESFQAPDAIVNGSSSYSTPGKYGIKNIFKKTSSFLEVDIDELADHKDHTMSPWIFKLLGLSMDINEMMSKAVYATTENGKYEPEDLIMGSYSIKGFAKGKMFKKVFKTSEGVEIRLFTEYYPISMEYLTADEARDLYDNPPKYTFRDFSDLPNLTPLPPAIVEMIERGNMNQDN